MTVGFGLAAYSIVANDAIQTLGTFLSSNAKRHWTVLWLYACSILTVVLVYSYLAYDGDLTYGRLGKLFESRPRGAVTLLHIIPPLFILFMTRFGWPVSTTFLVLTVFAPKSLDQMLIKSGLGYLVAFALGAALYVFVSRALERHFIATRNNIPPWWYGLQWASTCWLWSQWLVQDLANIFVYLPYTTIERTTASGEVEQLTQFEPVWLGVALVTMWGLHALTFSQGGGQIQKIVTSKTNATDVRSATIIDFLYGTILFVFKEMSRMPMSTTWVFIGLLAGRELGMTLARTALRTPAEQAKAEGRAMSVDEAKLGGTQDQEQLIDFEDEHKLRTVPDTIRIIALDAGKALAGLTVSVILAFALPAIYQWATGASMWG